MKEDIVFDLGMHKGEDTAFYLKKGFRVVGIEADPDLAEHCRDRFAAEISNGSVHVIEGAIVGKEKLGSPSINFYKSAETSVWGTTVAAWHDRNTELASASTEIEVPCLNFGAVLQEYGIPYYMKIDLEGADDLCLDYLSDVSERPSYLSIEDDGVSLTGAVERLARLHELGYRRFCAIPQSGISRSLFEGIDREGRRITHVFEEWASGRFGPDLPGPWLTREEMLIECKWIYEINRLFDESSPFYADPAHAAFRVEMAVYFQRALPGWYDIHASL